MLHFSPEITLGQIIISVPIIWILRQLTRITKMLINFRIEHEYLMRDWANRQTPPVKLEDLPTRRATWW